jgi:hypothetical protein
LGFGQRCREQVGGERIGGCCLRGQETGTREDAFDKGSGFVVKTGGGTEFLQPDPSRTKATGQFARALEDGGEQIKRANAVLAFGRKDHGPIDDRSRRRTPHTLH